MCSKISNTTAGHYGDMFFNGTMSSYHHVRAWFVDRYFDQLCMHGNLLGKLVATTSLRLLKIVL